VRRHGDADTVCRAEAVVLRSKGFSYAQAARTLELAKATVWQAVRRYLAEGEAGLIDRREDNGPTKVDDGYLDALRRTLEQRACDCGWPRPTWTRELLARTLARRTGTLVAPCTLSRALRRIGARRGRPRPVVLCPLSAGSRRRRLRAIERLREHLDPHEAMVYEDEVDIHLNPKIGWDWMPRGLTREVVTPGKNRKAYLAGALDVRSGLVHVVQGERKHSGLFLALLERLLTLYPTARLIHVVLDNYGIHSSRRVRQWLGDRGQRIRLHFLPPYSPNDNPIERVWLDLHANVTRNHCRRLLSVLLRDVHDYLDRRNRQARRAKARAA
jgi:transposase